MGIDDKRSEVQPDTSTRVSDPKNMSTLQPQSVQDLRQRSFQYMQDGFSIVDANGLHVDVNAAFCLMTGFSEEELIGYGPEHSYWPPEERDSIQHFLGKALHGEFAEIELVFMRKSGDRFPVLVNPLP